MQYLVLIIDNDIFVHFNHGVGAKTAATQAASHIPNAVLQAAKAGVAAITDPRNNLYRIY